VSPAYYFFLYVIYWVYLAASAISGVMWVVGFAIAQGHPTGYWLILITQTMHMGIGSTYDDIDNTDQALSHTGLQGIAG